MLFDHSLLTFVDVFWNAQIDKPPTKSPTEEKGD
jgi:hypothetical protein